MTKNNLKGSIILFDSTSNLHKKLLHFIEKREGRIPLSFIPFNSKMGKVIVQKLSLTKPNLSSVILLEDGKYYTQSTAILKLTRYLRGGWFIVTIFLILPKVVRDNIFLKFIKTQ